MIKKVEYHAFGCYEVSNAAAAIIVSEEFGPRVLSYSLPDGENILGWHPEAKVETELGVWRPYGGHRLWIAPENMPMSYAPDNEPVDIEILGDLAIKLSAPVDAAGIEKEMKITLAETGSGVTIEHRITNHGDPRELSAWALTIMAPGGEAVIPNEQFRPYGGDTLLPIRTMAVWPYTDFTDPRWTFTKDAIVLRVDENAHSPQKIGVLNKQGWVGYRVKDVLFKKSFEYIDDAVYPDMNCNTEIYTAGSFVEVETLAPLTRLASEEEFVYFERWQFSFQ